MADEAILGLNDLKAKLDELPLTIRRKMLVSSVRKGADLIRRLAQHKAPVGATRRLSSGMTMKVDESGPTAVQVDIGPSKDAFYGWFEENGAAPHSISLDGKIIHHPGIKAQPFLRPAFDEGQEEALQIIQDDLAYQIGQGL